MSNYHKLITSKPIFEKIGYSLLEEKVNGEQKKTMYITGPFLMAEQINKNGRVYQQDEMDKEVIRYKKEMIDNNRALGELGHPENAEVSLERACHCVVSLEKQDNLYIGKSKILSTDAGKVVRCLIEDGVTVGVSSRALGKLSKSERGDLVSDLKLICIDVVSDPSAPTAFVDGILESKKFVLVGDSVKRMESAYEEFEDSVATLPKKQRDEYVTLQLEKFFKQLRKYS